MIRNVQKQKNNFLLSVTGKFLSNICFLDKIHIFTIFFNDMFFSDLIIFSVFKQALDKFFSDVLFFNGFKQVLVVFF